MNLNHVNIEDAEGGDGLKDNSIVTASTSVYFRNLEAYLIRHIEAADAVVGAVAWLSNYAILDSLAKKDTVSIVVQKEDFLRPDSGSNSNFHQTIRRKYEALKVHDDVCRYSLRNTVGHQLSYGGDPTLAPIRCAGNHNSAKKPSHPRMHNKFLVFCKSVPEDEWGNQALKPYAVWTGSFNFSYAGSMSLENAVVLTEQTVVDAYFKEFAQIYAISEELDWQSEWCAPEFRIGS